MTDHTESPEAGYGLSMTVTTTRDVTVAVLRVVSPIEPGERHPGYTCFTGSARRHPGDADIPDVGTHLAVARALRQAADCYEDYADDLVARSGQFVGSGVAEPVIDTTTGLVLWSILQ